MYVASILVPDRFEAHVLTNGSAVLASRELLKSPYSRSRASSQDRRLPKLEPVLVIVDDNPDVLAGLAISAAVLGFTPLTVTSGEAALPIIGDRCPDVVLIDLCMPGISGWDVARRIRGSPLRRQPWLVAITGLTDDVIRARSMSAGFDAHLLKPISVEALRRALPA